MFASTPAGAPLRITTCAPGATLSRCLDVAGEAQSFLDGLFDAGARVIAVATKPAGSVTAPTQAEIDKTVTQLKKVVQKAHVDLWVGKSDHKVHRVTFTVDAKMDDATKTSSGLDGLTLSLDVTTVDADAPDIKAPDSVGTPAEFQQALVGLLTKVMSGASAG